MSEVWYRYVDGPPVEDRDDACIVLLALPVVRHTATGVQLAKPGRPRGHRFVRYNGKKAFARPTKEAALMDYMRRKEWHMAHLTRQYDATKVRLVEVARMIGAGDLEPRVLAPFFGGFD